MKTQNKMSTKTLVLGAILTALVVVLQFVAVALRPTMVFAISLVLVPIVIGAATCGKTMGAWLGFIFGLVVLLSGDAAAFLPVNPIGTVITVLLKGTACGFIAALVYNLLKKYNRYIAVAAAAIVCPVVNTGIFLIGCKIFFMDTISTWAGGGDVVQYMIFTLVGVNFLIELAINLVLSPIIVRLLNIKKA